MKLNKKSSLISLFVAGTLLFGTVAMADVMIGDGYNGAKQALKHTTKTLANDVDSFTVDVALDIKCDGTVCASNTSNVKYDLKNKRSEENNYEKTLKNGESTYYYYNDSKKIISKSSSEEQYYQTNLSEENDSNSVILQDPFEEEIAADLEKIADAFVGNMKDFVQIKNTDDGGKIYFGTLDSSQIPALVNAVSSVGIKYSLFEEHTQETMSLPAIKDNIYCKEVSGKLSQNADGLLESFVGSAIIVGTDINGENHAIEIAGSCSLTDINSTIVNEPNISKDKIIESTSYSYNCFDETDIGTYKNDVAVLENGSYKKIGERVLTISEIDDDQVTAHLTVTGTSDDLDCDIVAVKNGYCYLFDYTDASGESKQGVLEKTVHYDNNYSNATVYLDTEENAEKEEGSGWRMTEKTSSFVAMRVFD